MNHVLKSIAILVTLLLVTGVARADLRPCTEQFNGEKVYLDDVRPTHEADAASLATLIQRVTYKLDANLRAVEKKPGSNLRVLACDRRFPEGDAIFTPTLSRNLMSEKVLLEVWSQVRRDLDDDGNEVLVVDLSAALLPMLANVEPGAPSGVLRCTRRCKPSMTKKQMFKALDSGDLLWGLSRIACGLHDLRLGRNAEATGPLCDGVRILRRLKDPEQLARAKPLADHVEALAAAASQEVVASGAIPAFVTDAASCEATP